MEEYRIYWNRHDEKEKYLIGLLCHQQEWVFWYNKMTIEKAISKGFCPFPEMPIVGQIYTSKKIFKTFEHRLYEPILTDNIVCKREDDSDEKSRCIQYRRNK